jgi:hypothetical protein
LRANGLALIVLSAAGCSGDSADLTPVRLRHNPPIARLNAEHLKALSLECEKYPLHDSMRGPYDAAYCEEAIAAWGDSPLQMINIAPAVHPADSSKDP